MSRNLTKPLPGAEVDWNHPLSRGLVAWWLFNERTGSQLIDIAGRNHGTLTNMDPTSDWVGSSMGGALDFDGTNDFVEAPNHPSLQITAELTISAFVTRRVLDAAFREIVRKGPGYFFTINSQNEFVLSINSTGFNDGFALSGTGKREHLVGSYKDSTDSRKLYLDGRLVFSPATTQSIITNTNVLRIGATESNNQFFNGSIDDVRIWNRQLDDSEVLSIYQEPYAAILQPKHTRYSIPAAVDDQVPMRRIFPIPLYS